MSAIPVEQIMKLPVEERLPTRLSTRLRLVEDIWESIRAHPDDLPLTDAQRAELDRRLEAYRADPEAGDDLDTVLSRIRNKQ